MMDEQEWLSSIRPQDMLDHIRPQASERKMRLFACACCRLAWDRITEDRSRVAVEVSERYADGEATASELHRAHREACDLWGRHLKTWDTDNAAARLACEVSHENMMFINTVLYGTSFLIKPKVVVYLFRQIFGNPFRPVEIQRHLGKCCGKYWHTTYCGTCKKEVELPSWLTPQVVSLAQACYDQRDAAYFGLIWDALEEAGCDCLEIEMALKWMGRCPKCLGSGKDWVQYGHGRSYTAKCFCCGEIGPSEFGTGYLPLPGEPFMVRGFWVTDLFLGLN